MEGNPEPKAAAALPAAKNTPLEIHVHGLTVKVFLNRPEAELIPTQYLKQADKSSAVQRTIWVFRSTDDARNVNLNKWSKVDIRFRGIFKTLEKVPRFRKGLYAADDNNNDDDQKSAGSSHINGGRRGASQANFDDAVKAQGQVVYALLDEILSIMKIRRETEDSQSYFFLRPRLLACEMEYWTGYREKYRDAPITAGFLAMDYHPDRGISRSVLPVSTTAEQKPTLQSALEGKCKLMLAQLLLHIHRLHPPGDKLPDQEVFLIGLHGSKLHILRAIFPGQKTSRLWSGRHNPTSAELTTQAANNANERFYTKQNIDRFIQQAQWHTLSSGDDEPDPRTFRILGSKEYDLWLKGDFRAAVRMLVGLTMYLMSGKARCGLLQHVFGRYPYEEEDEDEVKQERERKEEIAKEQEKLAEQEREIENLERLKLEQDRERIRNREAMRSSANDHIGGFKGFRKPCWDWVWEDKHSDGCAEDDANVVLVGP